MTRRIGKRIRIRREHFYHMPTIDKAIETACAQFEKRTQNAMEGLNDAVKGAIENALRPGIEEAVNNLFLCNAYLRFSGASDKNPYEVILGSDSEGLIDTMFAFDLKDMVCHEIKFREGKELLRLADIFLELSNMLRTAAEQDKDG